MIEKLYNYSKRNFNNSFLKKIVYKISKVLINTIFPIKYSKFSDFGLDDSSEIIVSLTSFPYRINTVWMTVVTLLNQTKKPKKIILWLSDKQFRDISVPKSLTRLTDYGLEIRWCDDLKPHKKYFYTMQEYPDYCIVTADDDIFYPETHLELLWKNHKENPHYIIANRTNYIEFTSKGEFKPYNSWSNNTDNNPSYLLVPIGCNGVLYPPRILPKSTFDFDFILKNDVLFTDDLWLKFNELKSMIKTYTCKENELVYFDCIEASKVGLWQSNTKQVNRNDIVWNDLMDISPEIKTFLYNQWLKENKDI